MEEYLQAGWQGMVFCSSRQLGKDRCQDWHLEMHSKVIHLLFWKTVLPHQFGDNAPPFGSYTPTVNSNGEDPLKRSDSLVV
jgi:hypothetical protein